jgi:hypothetical protein
MVGTTAPGELRCPVDPQLEMVSSHVGKTEPLPSESREMPVGINPELSSGGLEGLKTLIYAATVDLTSQVIEIVDFETAWPQVTRGTHCRCIHGQGLVDWSSEDSVMVIHTSDGNRPTRLSRFQSSIGEGTQALAFGHWFDSKFHLETTVEEAEEVCAWVIAMNSIQGAFTEEIEHFLDANGNLAGSCFDLVPNNFARLVCRRCSGPVHLADEQDRELGLPNFAHFRAWLSFNSAWDRLDTVRTTSFQKALPKLKGWSPEYDKAMEDRTVLLDFDPTVDTPVHAGITLQDRPADHGFNYTTSGAASRSQRVLVKFFELHAAVLGILSNWDLSGLMIGVNAQDVLRHIEFAWFRLREPPRTDPKNKSPYHNDVGKGKLFFEFSGLASFQVKSTLDIPERDELGRKISRASRQGDVAAMLESRSDMWHCATNYSFGAPWMPWQQYKLHNYADAMSHSANLAYVPKLWTALLKEHLRSIIVVNNRFARFVHDTNKMTEYELRAAGVLGGNTSAFRRDHPNVISYDLVEARRVHCANERKRMLSEIESTKLELPLISVSAGRKCLSGFATPGTMKVTGWVHNREEVTRL